MSLLPRPSRRSLITVAALGAGSAVLAACGDTEGGGNGSGTPTVVVSCYPLRFLAERVAGDAVEIVDLIKPGGDGHGLELSVKQVMEVQGADLVLQIAGFQTALDDAISSGGGDNALEVSSVVSMLPVGDHAGESADDGHEGHDHGPNDPHVWHDPVRMADVADAIADRLGEILPDRSAELVENAQALRTELEELDAELAAHFDGVEGERTFITSHAAYAYLADRYGLHQVGIAGVDPETEPSPQRLLALENVVVEQGVTTIFFETSASPKVAQTLAANVGVSSEELDNLETQLSPDADYPQVMRENCSKLLESWA